MQSIDCGTALGHLVYIYLSATHTYTYTNSLIVYCDVLFTFTDRGIFHHMIFDFTRPPGKVMKLEIKLQKTKTASIKDDLNGRQPKWKTTSMEDNHNER